MPKTGLVVAVAKLHSTPVVGTQPTSWVPTLAGIAPAALVVSVVVPNGFRLSDGTPTSVTFTGRLFGEADLLAVADLYQRATDFHVRRPRLPDAPPKKG